MNMETQKEIENAVIMRARAKLLEDGASALKKEANDTLGVLMPLMKLQKYTLMGVGTVAPRECHGSSLDKKKLVALLALHGLDPDVINEIIAEASTSWSKTVIQFSPFKENATTGN